MKHITKLFGSDLFLFFIIIIPFFLIYEYFEPQFITIPVVANTIVFLSQHILHVTSWVFSSLLGMPTSLENDIINLPNGQRLQMQFGCSGLEQFILVFIVILIIPGPWKSKLWFIPAGILIVHVVNVMRFIGIALFLNHSPQHFHFIHDWIFRPLIYLVIFLIWVVWVEFIARRNKKRDTMV